MGKRSRRTRETATSAARRGTADASTRKLSRVRSVRFLLAVFVALAVVGVAGAVFATSLSARAYACVTQLSDPPGLTGTDGFKTSSLGATHVAVGANVRYDFCPPTSGSHYNVEGRGPVSPGFYGPDATILPMGWIHNLEHGYTVALYSCAAGTCPSDADLAALKAFAAQGSPQVAARCEGQPKVVAVRFDDMTKPYALVAWQRALLLDSFDLATAQAFAHTWTDVTAPEKGAC
jgi:hypothetical protein